MQHRNNINQILLLWFVVNLITLCLSLSAYLHSSYEPFYHYVIYFSFSYIISYIFFLLPFVFYLALKKFLHTPTLLFLVSTIPFSLLLIVFFSLIVKTYTGFQIYDPNFITLFSEQGFFKEINIKVEPFWIAAMVFVAFTITYIFIYAIVLFTPTSKNSNNYIHFIAVVSCILFTTTLYLNKDRSIYNKIPLLGFWIDTNKELATKIYAIYPDPAAPNSKNIKIKKKTNILMILAEAFRNDHLNRETTPNLSRFITENKCITSKNHYTGSVQTSWGVFSAIYGLNSYNLGYFYRERFLSYPIDILRKNGYAIRGMTSSKNRSWDHGDLVAEQFDYYKEYSRGRADQGDQRITSEYLGFANDAPANQAYFQFLFLNSTHYSYRYPPSFEKFKPTMPLNQSNSRSLLSFEHRKKVRNRYKNSVMYVDHLVGSILESRKKEYDSGNLIFVFTGDHAEEIFDKGNFIGHSGEIFSPLRAKVPLVICATNLKKIEVPYSGHADIWPTIIDHLNISPKVRPELYSNGISLKKSIPATHLPVTTASGFPLIKRKISAINSGKRFIGKVGNNLESFELEKVHTLSKDKEMPFSSLDKSFFATNILSNFQRFLKKSAGNVNEYIKKTYEKSNYAIGGGLNIVGYTSQIQKKENGYHAVNIDLKMRRGKNMASSLPLKYFLIMAHLKILDSSGKILHRTMRRFTSLKKDAKDGYYYERFVLMIPPGGDLSFKKVIFSTHADTFTQSKKNKKFKFKTKKKLSISLK